MAGNHTEAGHRIAGHAAASVGVVGQHRLQHLSGSWAEVVVEDMTDAHGH